jgi:hypothetical protein
MDCSQALPFDKKRHLAQTWQMIARDNVENLARIQTYLKQAQIWSIWENYKPHLALGIALVVCIIIYLLG